MLKAISLTKSYGIDLVLQGVSFVLNAGDRAGLVGPNGSGKTTLLRTLAGEIEPDGGTVWLSPGSAVAYLPQYPADELQLTIREALRRGAGEVGAGQQGLTELERLLTEETGDRLDALLSQYAEARERFETLGGYTLEARMDEVVAGLSLQDADLDAVVGTLSGGNKTKFSLARLLLSGASILLLDEPTNYLDLPALLWLERFVTTSDKSYLIVSHDRRFLDETVHSILELGAEDHGLRVWPGNYSAYSEARRRQEEKRREAHQDQQEAARHIAEDIRRLKEQARGVESRTKSGLGADVQRRQAKKVAKKGKARQRRLEKQLEGPERIEKPRRLWGLHLADLSHQAITDDRIVLGIHDLSAGYGGRDVLHGVDFLLRGRDRLALLGENGSGKSTILRCVAGRLPYTGTIRLGPSIRPGILWQETDELPAEETVLAVFRTRTSMHEDEARTYLHKFLFSGDEVFKRVVTLSYGQRAKLALAVLILTGANFLVLDEPTSHLDMPALEAIEDAVAAYSGPLLVVSHDRRFLEHIGVNRVAVMDEGRLHPVDNVAVYEREVEQASAHTAC